MTVFFFAVGERPGGITGGTGSDVSDTPGTSVTTGREQREQHNQRAAGHPGWTQHRTAGHHRAHDLPHQSRCTASGKNTGSAFTTTDYKILKPLNIAFKYHLNIYQYICLQLK